MTEKIGSIALGAANVSGAGVIGSFLLGTLATPLGLPAAVVMAPLAVGVVTGALTLAVGLPALAASGVYDFFKNSEGDKELAPHPLQPSTVQASRVGRSETQAPRPSAG